MSAARIPQGGLPRPRPKLAPINAATTTTKHEERDLLGRYRIWYTKRIAICAPCR